jgi:hypothetical protein
MYTFKELYDSTKKYRPWARSYPDVSGKLVDIIPNMTSKILTFRYRVESTSKSNEGYNVWVQFYNVEMSNKPITSKSIKIIDTRTKEPIYFERISVTDPSKKNYVRVRCGCKDFQFRFAWEDRAVNALYGGPPKSYKRVSPPSGRPPVNPQSLPGMCKHIFAAVRDSQRFFMR